MKKLIFIIILHLIVQLSTAQNVDCHKHYFSPDGMACACDTGYCDFFSIDPPMPGEYQVVSSSKAGDRFSVTTGQVKPDLWCPPPFFPCLFSSDILVIVNRYKTYQKIEGFGGAFTDAACLNIVSLPEELQDFLMKSYFTRNGLNYNMGRVSIGGSDFSVRPYTYSDIKPPAGEPVLSNFALQPEDYLKIYYLLWALNLNPSIKYFASPWSAPAWMKTHENISCANGIINELKGIYYQDWANYFIEFLQSYKNFGINFWAITTQNEPDLANVPFYPFNCMGWLPEQLSEWIKCNLGPTLAKSDFKDVKIIIGDDQRYYLLDCAFDILNDPAVAKIVYGFGVHWYADDFIPPEVMDGVHERWRDKPIYATEACAGESVIPGVIPSTPVIKGSWGRGEKYAHDIIQDLRHWVAGWVDWNLALNMVGGPNWVGNNVDSPILVDASSGTFYKQPMFYAMGHFSKFIWRESIRIDVTCTDFQGLEIVAVERPDGVIVLVILNRTEYAKMILIKDTKVGYIQHEVQPKSINTLIYN